MTAHLLVCSVDDFQSNNLHININRLKRKLLNEFQKKMWILTCESCWRFIVLIEMVMHVGMKLIHLWNSNCIRTVGHLFCASGYLCKPTGNASVCQTYRNRFALKNSWMYLIASFIFNTQPFCSIRYFDWFLLFSEFPFWADKIWIQAFNLSRHRLYHPFWKPQSVYWLL